SAVIQIRDDFCPWNQVCYKLIVSPDGSTCQPTTQASDLGAIDLGGTSLETLMMTGRIRALKSGIVSQLDRAFAVERQPWMVDV
ncbi:MAG: GNAT family N-acetyltransferase, partial [SAR202 cluster bacterium]|nr:GNAT family N-acetyltransferase [SAR202 cluster bacterium]